MEFLPQDFYDYIRPDADRAGFIQDWFERHGILSHRTVIEGKNHILVQFSQSQYNPQFKIKTVIAHYDRVQESPGANDNSAADWQLMNWAVSLRNYPFFHNVRLFFTDGEELGWNTGVSEQGAYGIASVFRRLGITNDDVYVFDACGRGEIPILARTRIPDGVDSLFKKKFTDLYNRAQSVLAAACPERWMTLPVPYSDNASFLACGIPAVAITMLPADEATSYAHALVSNKYLEDAVMNRESTRLQRKENPSSDHTYKERMPLTWKLFHSQSDNAASLTPVSFTVMQRILNVLAGLKTPSV